LLIILLPILYYFIPQDFPINIDHQAFTPINLTILIGVMILALIANLLTFYAMKWEKITELEPLRLLQPLFAIILALFLFASERNIKLPIILAGLVASLALIFSHIRKHHFTLNKYAISAILGSLFFALELIVSNEILSFYPPLVFYLIRCTGILLMSIIIFKPSMKTIDNKTWRTIFLIGLIWIAYRLMLYTSYLSKGPVITTLLFMLTPVFIYIMSYLYLKEKPNWKNIVASIVILICVVYAMIINGNSR
jgi:drug/metabolite transporter (DMT)-like permease